eukprot:1851476-Prymnesium_polylepis.1
MGMPTRSRYRMRAMAAGRAQKHAATCASRAARAPPAPPAMCRLAVAPMHSHKPHELSAHTHCTHPTRIIVQRKTHTSRAVQHSHASSHAAGRLPRLQSIACQPPSPHNPVHSRHAPALRGWRRGTPVCKAPHRSPLVWWARSPRLGP